MNRVDFQRISALTYGLVAAALCLPIAEAAPTQGAAPGFTVEQAARGKAAYDTACAACHGKNLSDGPFAPTLKGFDFMQRWGGKPLDALFVKVADMPPGAPRSLGEKTYADMLAYLLQNNGVRSGSETLPTDPQQLRSMLMPATSTSSSTLSSRIELPPPPSARPNPLQHITPVTDAMLARPPEADWLTWRRGNDALGYSPLAQINRKNVAQLRLAWSWALPEGPSQVTPLVHDGVIFVQGSGEVVQALDGATGELLWDYRRWLPSTVAANPGLLLKRSVALYGERLFLGASDAHVVALDVKTGNVVWDTAIADLAAGYRITAGPLVAKGKVMIGTAGRSAGGNHIVALDAGTGQEAWRFDTIARPDQPGGDSWNGLPLEKRNGASVWTVGSYDPASGLAFFGTGNTYDTAPLLHPKGEAGVVNAGLHTNSTLAIDPDTGELNWSYQHLPNDQWDLDWAFERHLIRLPVEGMERTVLVTGGKAAIFDLLDAQTGRYLSSIDLGLQDFVTAIDPRSGAKRIDIEKLPAPGRTFTMCPHADGARNWIPSSFNPQSKILFVPLMEICMDVVPVPEGEQGVVSSGVRWGARPPANSDGRYGRLEAINLETHKVLWTHRQRAPRTSGLLATAGGLVFGGDLDRYFTAYDQDTGKELWQARLNDAANAAPITFGVNGKQYVGVTVGHSVISLARRTLVPEIRLPAAPAATLWVFEVP